LLPDIQQPARQTAASSRTYPAAHSTGISKTKLSARTVANIRIRPLRSLPVSEMPVQCAMASIKLKIKLSVLPIKHIGNFDYTFPVADEKLSD
jgi:hypothetical protein